MIIKSDRQNAFNVIDMARGVLVAIVPFGNPDEVQSREEAIEAARAINTALNCGPETA